MADTNLVELSYIKEVTWGVTPNTPALTRMRPSGESLGLSQETVESEEFRADRKTADITRVQVSAQGDVNGHFTYGTWDPFIESVLGSSFGAAVDLDATDVSATAAGNVYTTSGAINFSGLAPGDPVYVSGFTTAANNGWARVVSSTATTLVIEGRTLVDEAAGDSVNFYSEFCEIGTDLISFSIQKAFTDAGQYLKLTGMSVATFNLEAQTGAIANVSVSFLGKDGVMEGSAFAGATYSGPSTTRNMNVVDHFEQLWEGGAASTASITSLSLTLTSNLRQKFGFGSASAFGLGLGEVMVEGSMDIYFDDRALYEKFAAFTESQLSFSWVDADGNRYFFDLPSMHYTTGDVEAGGKNDDVIASFAFKAKVHATTGQQFVVARVPAA